MRKFFISSSQIKQNNIIILGEDVNHIKNVLRLKTGEQIKICNKDLSENYICEIVEISKEYIDCRIINKADLDSEGNIELIVFQGLPKADKMELIIQKCTELGARKFVPVQFSRSIVKLNYKESLNKIERWKKIAEVAAKQSQRDLVPGVEKIITVMELCKLIKEYDLVLLAYENEENNSLKNELYKIKNFKENLKIAIIVGPEGGIEINEVEELKKNGAKVVTLGKRILRTETVAFSMTSIIMYELEI
ncbi:MAG: 16S rRNA (uracil(1498)-N(3))-methyltransferase [Clostridia bacterium]|nr:16S rRNA (uracil(1498)-N(3))-methyltransferase [Clostridia bacterium]